jgi:hypothetical protein
MEESEESNDSDEAEEPFLGILGFLGVVGFLSLPPISDPVSCLRLVPPFFFNPFRS